MAILDLSKSFDASSLCNFEEITPSFHVYCKRGQQYTTVPQRCHLIFRGVFKDKRGAFYFFSQSSALSKLRRLEKRGGEKSTCE